MVAYEIAEVNYSRLLAPLDDPLLAGFVSQLDAVNAAAEAADGFRWRLKDGADATTIKIFDDDWLIVNMSVWESPAKLLAFVYDKVHRPVLRRRREWFARLEVPTTALWWVPAGHEPTVAEAEERLLRLRVDGPGPDVFTLREPYPAPDGTSVEPLDHLHRRRPAECDA